MCPLSGCQIKIFIHLSKGSMPNTQINNLYLEKVKLMVIKYWKWQFISQ